MAQVVLADEINRATPRTQSALLEAMQERQVTVDVETMPLPRPFLVLATQNPIELEGTFPLPEAQVDRFLIKIALGYPGEEDENEILLRYEREDPLETLEPVLQARKICWRCSNRSGRSWSRNRCGSMSSRWCAPRASTTAWNWASARAARWRSTERPRPWLPCGAATLSSRRRQVPGPARADPPHHHQPPDPAAGPPAGRGHGRDRATRCRYRSKR